MVKYIRKILLTRTPIISLENFSISRTSRVLHIHFSLQPLRLVDYTMFQKCALFMLEFTYLRCNSTSSVAKRRPSNYINDDGIMQVTIQYNTIQHNTTQHNCHEKCRYIF
ncbi:PREDICTED: uncharacterized protein LOC106742751 [Dinoponera quadriceps]|uniref:Uncharacterized protein LOC106742751 n=1 Tax=Dinoponera quadriceps TaxID=609295 RepID=A0A6P3WZH3_DINQU|nr:PREDICTED: uncharacterized protein LOC106742751 [Dinoponera quadriceps]